MHGCLWTGLVASLCVLLATHAGAAPTSDVHRELVTSEDDTEKAIGASLQEPPPDIGGRVSSRVRRSSFGGIGGGGGTGQEPCGVAGCKPEGGGGGGIRSYSGAISRVRRGGGGIPPTINKCGGGVCRGGGSVKDARSRVGRSSFGGGSSQTGETGGGVSSGGTSRVRRGVIGGGSGDPSTIGVGIPPTISRGGGVIGSYSSATP